MNIKRPPHSPVSIVSVARSCAAGSDGTMNGVAFRAYVEQVLAPTLSPEEDVAVMDYLPAHKDEGIR